MLSSQEDIAKALDELAITLMRRLTLQQLRNNRVDVRIMYQNLQDMAMPPCNT